MGYDASCEVRFEGRTTQGTAVLEPQALIVRGHVRLSIPLATITQVTVDERWLRIEFDGRRADLALGAAASKWASRIANPPSRLTKLGVKPGMRVLALGDVDELFIEELRGAGAVVARRPSRSAFDLVFYAVDRREALDRLTTLAAAIVPSGAIWTLRPKGSRSVSEAETMAAGKRAGLVDVKVVSFSQMLTAEKFVIPVAQRPKPATEVRRATARR